MSDPWDLMSKDPLSETELRKLRRHMEFLDNNDTVLRRMMQIARSWWLLPLGVALAVSGALGGIVEIISNKAGL